MRPISSRSQNGFQRLYRIVCLQRHQTSSTLWISHSFQHSESRKYRNQPMSEIKVEDTFEEFRQEVLASAAANKDFEKIEFLNAFVR